MRFEDSKLRRSFQVGLWQFVYGARCCSLLSSNFFFLSRAVKLARFVDRTIHEGNSTPATFPNFPKSCPPRSDDALLMKLGGVKGLEGIWSFVVLNLEEFLVLLFKSGYLHSLACWLLMCLPGALFQQWFIHSAHLGRRPVQNIDSPLTISYVTSPIYSRSQSR